jgi:hypothetical protein
MKLSSFHSWFLLLLSLNICDILTTVPAYEANPLTLYFWQRIGFLPAAWFKIGLVLFLGVLFILAQKAATPREKNFAEKVFLGLLRALVAFYVFVVLVNIVVLSQV